MNLIYNDLFVWVLSRELISLENRNTRVCGLNKKSMSGQLRSAMRCVWEGWSKDDALHVRIDLMLASN